MSNISSPKIIRSNRKTLALQVLPNATLVVKAPLFLPKFLIDRFVQKNLEWIKRKTEVVKRTKITKKEYKEGEEFLYLGVPYKLKIGNYKIMEFKDGELLFPNFLVFRIQKELSTWYINRSKKLITQEVEYYAKEMKTSFKELRFSDTRSKWGSCTHDNRLQFSWRLIMAPLLVLKYVIIHELAHTFEKNHSRAFWSKVRLYNPSYKQQIKWLKAKGRSLVN
jgi:predicted metal-dependent hydrolase